MTYQKEVFFLYLKRFHFYFKIANIQNIKYIFIFITT